LDLLKQQRIKPVIAALMPLNEAAHAHDLLEDGSLTGKIVLICDY
jgi:NADPH2:quinone reductase